MALLKDTAWEYDTAGSNNNSGGFAWTSLVNSTYKWTASGSGTNEYYVELAGGGDPGLTEAKDVYLDGFHNKAANGTMGSLAVSEWDWGDNDTLGYSTVYVRLADGADPDTKNLDFVGFGGAGGVDYSQQTAAEATFTNLSTDVAGTQITDDDAGGNMTALMVDNLIFIDSGVGFSTGWYQILTFIDSNNITIDSSAGSSATAGVGAIGGSRALMTDSQYEASVAGNTHYPKAGTYTISGIGVTQDGSSTNYIKNIFYNTTRGDAPTGNNRPLIAAAANTFTFDNFWQHENIRLTSSNATAGIQSDDASRFINIKSDNSANGDAISGAGGTGHLAFNCEALGTNGIGIQIFGNSCLAYGCYVHDLGSHGMQFLGNSAADFCIIDTCAGDGINLIGSSSIFKNNTIYNCASGISSASLIEFIAINNIIDSCTTGLNDSSSTGMGSRFSNYNNFNNNTTNYNNWHSGANDTFLDPGFTDAPNGDFSVGSTVQGTGFPGLFPGGLSEGFLGQGAVMAEGGNGGISSYGHFG